MGWWLTMRHGIEYGAARGAVAIVAQCPATALRGARAIADLAFRLGSGRRRIACDNILRAGLASDPADARRLARASFRHFGMVAIESAIAGREIHHDNWQDHVEMAIDAETLARFADPRQGVILATGHLGNWEVAGHILSFVTPISAVARPMNNPRVQALLDRYGSRGRMHILPKRSEQPRQLVRVLHAGRTLALLMDQYARTNAVMIPFFGRPAATHPSPAVLYRLSGAPIVFLYAVRLGFMRYRIVADPPWRPPLSADRAADNRTIMTELTRRLELAIRAYPDQYLWAHRRWREPAKAET